MSSSSSDGSFAAGWLAEIGLGEHSSRFASRDVGSKAELLQLLDESFCSCEDQLFYMGITAAADRAKLETELRKLSEANPTVHIDPVRKKKRSETAEETNTPQRSAFAAFGTQELCAWLEEVELPETCALCQRAQIVGAALLELVADEKKGVASLADMLCWTGIPSGQERITMEKHLRQMSGEGFIAKGTTSSTDMRPGAPQQPLISPEVAEERREKMKVITAQRAALMDLRAQLTAAREEIAALRAENSALRAAGGAMKT